MEDLQKKQGGKQKGKDNTVETILFSSLAMVALLLTELYLLVVMPGFLPGIAVVAVLILGCSYLDLAAFGRRMKAQEQFREDQYEQYANILKSEKASFLLIRKYCDEIELQISLLEERFADPIQEVVVAQKATAKVTINRNKENAYALMNSNDRMQEQIASIESRITQLSASLSGNAVGSVGGGDYSVDFSPIQDQLREMEDRLKTQMIQIMNQIPQGSVQPIPEPQAEIVVENDIEPSSELEFLSEPEATEEVEILPEPEPVDALEILPEEADSEPEYLSDSETDAETDLEILSEPEVVVESEPQPEPAAVETPSMPEMSDPNRAMSPDEIAALFANLD